MFNDPLPLTGKTSAGDANLPRINIDAGLGEFNKFSSDASKKATIKHSAYKVKGNSLQTERHTMMVEQILKRTDATNSLGYITVPYKAYIVIEHDSNAALGELAEVVANVAKFIDPSSDTTNLSRLMNKEV